MVGVAAIQVTAKCLCSVRVDIVGADEIADSTSVHVGGSPPGPLALRVAVARVGLERNRTELIEANHYPGGRARAIARHDSSGFLLKPQVPCSVSRNGRWKVTFFSRRLVRGVSTAMLGTSCRRSKSPFSLRNDPPPVVRKRGYKAIRAMRCGAVYIQV